MFKAQTIAAYIFNAKLAAPFPVLGVSSHFNGTTFTRPDMRLAYPTLKNALRRLSRQGMQPNAIEIVRKNLYFSVVEHYERSGNDKSLTDLMPDENAYLGLKHKNNLPGLETCIRLDNIRQTFTASLQDSINQNATLFQKTPLYRRHFQRVLNHFQNSF